MPYLRRLCAALVVAVTALGVASSPILAQDLPAGFFDDIQTGSQAQVEADMLSYDADADTVTALGGAIMRYDGYVLSADRIIYNRGNGDVLAEGNVGMLDPGKSLYRMERLELTGAMKIAFVQSLTLKMNDGSMVTANDVHYEDELRTTLNEASYSPCGLCIDEKGRRIGWKVYAAKIVQDKKGKVIYLDQPTLEVLGVPIAWVPWLALPDPTQRAAGFRMPRYSYSATTGHSVEAPYFIPIGDSIDLLMSPRVMSRQGFLLGAEWEQRFDYGRLSIKAAGLYQMDRSAFAGTVGDLDWRGAATASGEFSPIEDWKVGFSYTAFTDSAFLPDYGLTSGKNSINELYAVHLSNDYYADLRIQKFNLLGNVTAADQNKQVHAIPNIKAGSYTDLGEGGQNRTAARVMGIQRGMDSTATFGVVPYVFGYQENKVHASIEASWQKQFIAPMGVAVTPYLGLRADYASYDGASALPSEPTAGQMFNATPIAAVDFRWPLVSSNGIDSFLLEPVAQLVYRGSSTTDLGITNDNAQSFVFDDTNLFSYDRFSGSDRQETGLRANIGGRYMANFGDGTWLELIGGQSYHLAGANALGIADAAQTGNSTGLGGSASYIVLGAKGSPMEGLTLGAKAQLDPNSFRVARAGAGAQFVQGDYRLGLDYFYLPANPTNGTLADQHEATIRGRAPLPMWDYWYADASLSWDIAQGQFLEATGGITYDDKFFAAGAFGSLTGSTHSTPNNLTYGVTVKFRTPGSEFSPLNY